MGDSDAYKKALMDNVLEVMGQSMVTLDMLLTSDKDFLTFMTGLITGNHVMTVSVPSNKIERYDHVLYSLGTSVYGLKVLHGSGFFDDEQFGKNIQEFITKKQKEGWREI